MPMKLEAIKKIAIPACNAYGVTRMDIFGSSSVEAEQPNDVDLLVEFDNPEESLSHRYFSLLHYLEDQLGCKVDLLTVRGIKNPYFRQKVMSTRKKIYER
jgi:uncharacterized protein